MSKSHIGTQAVVHKLVFELRYDFGYAYLDRAGTAINDILRNNPGWFQDAVNPQQGILRHRETETIFTFNIGNLNLSQSQSENIGDLLGIDEFAAIAERFADAVRKHLGLEQEDFTRIGFRIWQLFEQDSLAQAKRNVKELGLVSLEKLNEVTGKDPDEVNCSFIVNRAECSTRIAVAPVEQAIAVDPATIRQAKQKPHMFREDQKQIMLDTLKAKHRVKRYPQFAILVDMDHYIIDPPYPKSLNISSDFLAPNFKWSKETAVKLLD